MIDRGHVYFVALGPVVGSEMNGGKKRPVAVLSINDINHKPLVITVVPGTSTQPKRRFNNIVCVEPTSSNGLTNPTYFQTHQLRALDQSRFLGDPAGKLTGDDLDQIREAVMYTLGFGGRPGKRIQDKSH